MITITPQPIITTYHSPNSPPSQINHNNKSNSGHLLAKRKGIAITRTKT